MPRNTNPVPNNPIEPKSTSPLLTHHLPIELRLQIYSYVLPPTKTCSLYLTLSIWTCHKTKPKPKRTFLNLLLVCRQIHNEAVDILYARHELQLYTAHGALQTRVAGLREYTGVFQRVQRMRLTVFVTGEWERDHVIVALMGWLKAVLAQRREALKSLTLEFWALGSRLQWKPTAVVYVAQRFQRLGPTKFEFQGVFSGMVNEDAMEALMVHGNEKMRVPGRMVGEEEAWERYLRAWGKSGPGGFVSKMLND